MWEKSNTPFVSNLNIIPRILGVTSGLSAQRQSSLCKHNTGTHERREEKNPHSVLSTVRDTTMKEKYARSIHTLQECTKSKNSITVWKLGVMSVEWARFHARTQTKRLDDKTCITWMPVGNTRTSNIAEFPQATDHVIRRNLKFPRCAIYQRFVLD